MIVLHLKKTPLSYLIALTLFLSLPSCSSLRYVSGDHQASTTWTKQELKPQKRRPVTSSQRQQERGTTRLPREVSSLLERSGVKMAAVEFYATWCKPCMEAVPRWKALHDKYRAQGLRLIVINTQDPNGACTAPGWAPDELVCDLEGHVAEAMKVGTLPSAFLYSWQGNTLVKRGHIDEVEREIEAYMLRNPRVRVETDIKGPLENVLRNELARKGKFTVVATQEEKLLAAKARKQGYQSNYQAKGRCKLGQEISPNSVLRASLVDTLFNLQLFSAESSCLLQGVSVRFEKDDLEGTVAESVDKLIDALKVR